MALSFGVDTHDAYYRKTIGVNLGIFHNIL